METQVFWMRGLVGSRGPIYVLERIALMQQLDSTNPFPANFLVGIAWLLLTVAATLTACSADQVDGYSTPTQCRPSGTRPKFLVATYNIHAGVGRDGTRDVHRIAEILNGAQLVGLQEVDNGRVRSGFDNQGRVVAGQLGHLFWQHFPAEDYWPFGTYGTAVSTSLPVMRSGAFDLPIVAGKPLRRLAWITFLVDCRPIHAFIIHVTRTDEPSGTLQWAQVRAALSIMAGQLGDPPERHILMGDFNAGPDSLVIVKLREQFVDALSATSGLPSSSSRTDYIFVSGDQEVVSAREVNDGSSDHPAVFATLR